MIPFNKPYMTGEETEYIRQAVGAGHISGNGAFTKKCQRFFEERYSFKKSLLTTSCTDALEMAAMLCGIAPGDEVIMPSYTFVSTALAFVRQGAKIIFIDSCIDNPNLDTDTIESLISPKTKAIVPVHYAGCSCDMDAIMALAQKYNLFVIEDAAQAVDSFYTGKDGHARPLGSIGHLGCFSFHETKNLISGEGGMLAINDERFMKRAEIVWEKGTNRAEFFRGEVDKYGWVDVGSSFLPSDIIAAFLWAQIEHMDDIQAKRKAHWDSYYSALKPYADQGYFKLPTIPTYSTNNAHMFYIVFPHLRDRSTFIAKMKEHGISCVFHYLSLHSSDYYSSQHDGRPLLNSDHFSNCLVRLPMFYELPIDICVNAINAIFQTSPSLFSK